MLHVDCSSKETMNFKECPESDEENQKLSHCDALVAKVRQTTFLFLCCPICKSKVNVNYLYFVLIN